MNRTLGRAGAPNAQAQNKAHQKIVPTTMNLALIFTPEFCRNRRTSQAWFAKAAVG
jgi:hypothetical protein